MTTGEQHALSDDQVRGRYCDGTYLQTGHTTDGSDFDAWLARVRRRAAIRGRAVVIYRERARQAEAGRDEWRQIALDERAAALDALEQLKLRDVQIQAAQLALNYRPEETPR